MGSFDIDAQTDIELGLGGKGKREVMAGISDENSKGNLVSWTLRHENGHAVDEQIKFRETRAKLAQFGGWRMYDTHTQYAELAAAFLTKSGFSDKEITKVVALTLPQKKVIQKSLQVVFADALIQVTGKGAAAVLATGPISFSKAEFAKGLGVSKTDLEAKLDAAIQTINVAMAHPWTFADGGGDLVKHGDRMYHRDQYNNWVSYLASARDTAVSNYQFSSPGEWFAEAYAAVYDGQKTSSARARLGAPVVAWFTQNLGPPTHKKKDAKQAQGKLEDKTGNLNTLDDLDDAVVAALSNPKSMATVKLADLPDDLKTDVAHLQGF